MIKCDVKRRFVPCDILASDFAQLAKQLPVRPKQENAVQRLAIQFLKRQQTDYDPASEEQKHQEAIKAFRMRMTNLKHAFLKRLEVSAKEYDVEMDEVKRGLAY